MFAKSFHATLVPVKKMDRAVRFYTDTLGGRLLYRGEGEMKNTFAITKLAGEEFWLFAPETWERRTLSYSVFVVKRIKSVVRELQAKGVKFEPGESAPNSKVEGPITRNAFGSAAFFKDSEGNLLMLWQNSPPM